MFGGELYGQSLVQEFGKIFLSRYSGTEQTFRRNYRKELLELCSELSEGDREDSEKKISELSQCFSTLKRLSQHISILIEYDIFSQAR